MEVTRHLYAQKPRKKRKRSRISGDFVYTRQQLEKVLWNTFSLYVRMRDGMRCVQAGQLGHKCCGYLQAGHVIPRGFKPVKYDERNVFAQCEGGNEEHHRLKEESPYTLWFINSYGERFYRWLWAQGRKPWKERSPLELKKLISLYQHKTARVGR